ncbi:MAG: hypothetical protein ACLQF1_01550 [Methyloceanibacter sp.]
MEKLGAARRKRRRAFDESDIRVNYERLMEWSVIAALLPGHGFCGVSQLRFHLWR